MIFALTDSLINQMKNALENQEKKFLLDAEKSILIEKDDSVKADNEKYYELPEWTSANGFELRQSFVDSLYAPIAHEELQNVLHSGRGVFKNFREIIKKYPNVETKWNAYKNSKMLSYINSWYNELREIWGLEKLDYIPESDSNLIHDDFNFCEYDSEKDKETVILNMKSFYNKNNENLPEELEQALYEMWLNQFESTDSSEQTGIICRSLSDDFVGCIITVPISKQQKKIVKLTNLFVSENFRGLGIATELFSMCMAKLKESGKKWILLPDVIIPEIMLPLLLRMGFEKAGSGYIKTI